MREFERYRSLTGSRRATRKQLLMVEERKKGTVNVVDSRSL